MRRPGLLQLLLLVLPHAGMQLAAGAETWLPERGRAALHQRVLQLEKPAVALLIARRPGTEDLPLLAYLRFQTGARVAVAYLTNGESAPGDTLAGLPSLLAAQRKTEAYDACTAAGAEAWFANLPDIAAPENAPALARAWPADTLVSRLTAAIRTFKPDLLIVGRQETAAFPSPADSVVREAALASAARAASEADTNRARGLLPWHVERLLAEQPARTLGPEFGARHPVWHLSSTEMAGRLASAYRSLRLSIRLRQTAGRAYARLGQVEGNTVPVRALLEGLPRLSPRLRGLETAVHRAVRIVNGLRSASLAGLTVAIDSSEQVLRRFHNQLSRTDERVAVAWKTGLEDARCTVLNVRVELSPGDSLVAASQVWMLRIRSLTPAPRQGTTEIIFPLALQLDWTVNETLSYRFPFAAPAEFRILTPEALAVTEPILPDGMLSPNLRTVFPFFIVHNDPRRELNFMYRGEVRLRVGPRRTFELLTPLVRAYPGSRVVVSMLNVSRDPFKGTVTLRDTSGAAAAMPVELERKDQRVVDTLSLPYAVPPPPGTYPWTVELSSRGGRHVVTAKTVYAHADTSAPVYLLSAVHGSPVAGALETVGVRASAFASADLLPAGALLVIDRDALSTERPGLSPGPLRKWILAGGRILAFPQSGDGARRLQELCGASFIFRLPLPPESAVAVTPGTTLMTTPNRLDESAWDGWVVSRAWCTIALAKNGPESSALALAADIPLLAAVTVGRGRVTLVAADLPSQFMNLHEGVYRLFANLMAMR